MLALTRRTDYALITLAHLARHDGSLSTAREIADLYHLPLAMLTNVLKALAQHELVESVRGAHGGYRLGKPAGKISLLSVMEALEGQFRLVTCVPHATEDAIHDCDLKTWCPIQAPIRRLHQTIARWLEQTSVADICGDEAEPAPVLIQATVVHR